MFAVKWGIKKINYDLKERKFVIQTDHKVLLEIKKKQRFNNDKINGWIEEIREFDFEIKYIERKLLAQLTIYQESMKIKITKEVWIDFRRVKIRFHVKQKKE